MNREVSGVVLRAKPSGERDMILTLLTAEEGRIHALARSVGRNRKQSVLYAQNFVYSRFQLFRGRGMYVVDGAEPLESFYGLRRNLTRLALAQYFADVANRTAGETGDGEALLSLLLNSLYLLSNTDLDETLLKVVYEVRFCLLEGSLPPVECTKCGGPAQYWSFPQGFLCEDCKVPDGAALTPGMAAALKHICESDGRRVWSFELSRESLEYLSRLTGAYVEWIAESRFDSLDYYFSLMEFGPSAGEEEPK